MPNTADHPFANIIQTSGLFAPGQQPMKLLFRHRKSWLSARIRGINPLIEVSCPPMRDLASHGELNVLARWKGHCWDMLTSLDARPIPVTGGHLCEPCRITHPDLRTFWERELFVPFLDWVQDALIPAHTLNLWKSGGASWARLSRSPDAPLDVDGAELVASLPVYVND